MKHDDVTATPPTAHEVFGANLATAERYAELLMTAGVERGLIGPRETPRIWDRHILNSAVLAELIEPGQRVVDIGSGAGLPGIPMAIARPDLTVTLVEPLLRRATFLSEAVETLGLSNVTVVRGRAEEREVLAAAGEADVVVSRAVAALDKLTRWSIPLLRIGGQMMALKGDRAQAEIDECRHLMESLGAVDAKVVRCGVTVLDPAATAVVARRSEKKTTRRHRTGSRRGR